MGLIWNARKGSELLIALMPLANATTEGEFRALLAPAEAVGKAVYGGGKRASFAGSARDKVLDAAVAPMAARRLLDQGEFFRAQAIIRGAVQGLQSLLSA